MNSGRLIAVLCVLPALAVLSFGGEAGDEYGEEFLTPKERAELDLKRKREAQPVLVVEPSKLEYTIKEGETAKLKLTVMNAGGRTLNWQVAAVPEWLGFEKRSGLLRFGEKEELTVGFRAHGRTSGPFEGTFYLVATGAAKSPLKIPVILDITPKLKPLAPTKPPEPRRPSTGEPSTRMLPTSSPRAPWRTAIGTGREPLALRSGFLLAGVGGLVPDHRHSDYVLGRGLPGNEKGFCLFLGVAAGTDSNYALAEAGKEVETSVTEMIGGVAFHGGNYRRKYEFRYQAQMDNYSAWNDTVLRESRAVAGVATHSQKVEFAFRTRYASLSDVVLIESTERLLGRDQMSLRPEVSFSTGRTDIGLDYTATSMRYDPTDSRLDHEDDRLGAEFRWWRSEVTQVFAHFDSGRVDYAEAGKSDFDYSRIYAGLRTEAPSRMGLSLGLGVQELSAFQAAPTASYSRFFATARLAFTPGAGTSKLEFGCALVDEASARSRYKSVSLFEIRYLRRVNRRLNWSVRLRSESADLVDPMVSTPDSVSGLQALAGVDLKVGAVDRLHGRVFATVAYQTWAAGIAEYEFERLRATGGFALVY